MAKQPSTKTLLDQAEKFELMAIREEIQRTLQILLNNTKHLNKSDLLLLRKELSRIVGF